MKQSATTKAALPDKLQLAHGMICYTDHDMEPITDRDGVPIIELDLAAEMVLRWNRYGQMREALQQARTDIFLMAQDYKIPTEQFGYLDKALAQLERPA